MHTPFLCQTIWRHTEIIRVHVLMKELGAELDEDDDDKTSLHLAATIMQQLNLNTGTIQIPRSKQNAR